MNVLVYDGPGTSALSLRHSLHSLRQLLPAYSVQKIGLEGLLHEPWTGKAAALIIPGGRDLPYCRDLDGRGTQRIREYVMSGGRYIGLCAGGYFGSQRVEFELGTALEVKGDRELSFFPGIAKGCVYRGFSYDNELGARAATLTYQGADGQVDQSTMYYNGGCQFVLDGDKEDGKPTPTILATYTEDDHSAAVVLNSVGKGSALLVGTHPEYDPFLLDPTSQDYQESRLVEQLRTGNPSRLAFLRHILRSIGLTVSDIVEELEPQGVILACENATIGEVVVGALRAKGSPTQRHIIDGGVDRLALFDGAPPAGTNNVASIIPLSEESAKEPVEEGKEGREWPVYLFPTAVPPAGITPGFDVPSFFSVLRQAREKTPYRASSASFSFGNVLLYGPIVSSTQTLLERNSKWTSALPNGTTFVAERQVAARGRGGNAWVSPAGCLQFSMILRHPYKGTASAVFIQYLVSIAVVEAVRTLEGYESLPIRLKWPNDIYAEKTDRRTGKAEWVKIGGVLVQSSFMDDAFVLVIGCGVNVDNAIPSTSINAVIQTYNDTHNTSLKPLAKETILARALALLDDYYAFFLWSASINFILPRYYELWLHRGAEVTLAEEGGKRVRILGITEDYGMLETVAIGTDGGELIPRQLFVLQPDGNSFDMLHGLIARKAN